jgi:hypothetical protein
MLLMAANHVALAMPEPWLGLGVLLGRASLPLFVAIIVLRLSCATTGRARRYLGRLVLWGLIAQPVYQMLLAGQPEMRLNVLFTLAAGVSLIYLSEEGLWLLAAAVAGVYLTGDRYLDGGAWMAVALWLAWLVTHGHAGRQWLSVSLVALAALLSTGLRSHLSWGHALFAGLAPLLAFHVLFRLSPKLPRLPGWLFYAFYPAHLAVILMLHGPY